MAPESSTRRLRIALAQVDATVGDVSGNAERIRKRIAEARDAGAQLVVFPELVLTGYPPEDLLLKGHFLEGGPGGARKPRGGCRWASRARRLRRARRRRTFTTRPPCSPTARSRAATGRCCSPTTAYSTSGATSSRATAPALIELGGVRLGLTICEDIWFPGPPASAEAIAGASLDRQPLRLSVPPRQAGRARADGRTVAPARPARRSRSATWSGARTSWSSTATA